MAHAQHRPDDDSAVVSVDGLDVTYTGPRRKSFPAVQDISFDVSAGQRFIIIGPSGCGKTTVLMTIAGFLTPASGRIRSGNTDISGPGPDRAVVFQEFDQLFPWRTVVGNLTYALEVTHNAKGERAKQVASEFLDLVGIGHATENYPHELSGGMKMRAALARALALQPDVLLMDEPFGAVDEITRTTLQRELDRICRTTHTTLIMVTHSIQEAAFLGDQVMVMSTGPGTIRDIVDTSSVHDLDGSEFADTVGKLRGLLDSSTTRTPDSATTAPARSRS